MNRTIPLLALLLGTLPIVAINATYLIAAAEGYVPWCVPYWDSCTSISATGREGTAFYFFKATMIPMALLYGWYWKLTNITLGFFGYRGKSIQILGIIAAIALIGYTLALGIVGDNFRLTRRIGIIIFFTLTCFCQLLVVYRTGKLKIPDPTRYWQLSMSAFILGVGVLTLLLGLMLDNYDDFEDAFEWVIAILIHLNFLIAYRGWRAAARNLQGSIN